MGDLKLFQLGKSVTELPPRSVDFERELQRLIEANCETLLGVTFLASEHSTGERHAGRIDTLGLDENLAPVIIEYKKTQNQNVINQGLFYLDWLDDHRADFTLLAMDALGPKVKDQIAWDSTRVLCIAYEFTRFDEHAVAQMGRNIELIRYRQFGDGFLALELVNTPGTSSKPAKSAKPNQDRKKPQAYRTASQALDRASPELKNLFELVDSHLADLGDDVTSSVQKYYFAYRRIRNFACVEPKTASDSITMYLKVDPASIALEKGFTRDVSKVGHYGTGDLEVIIRNPDDLKRALPLISRSYNGS